MAPTSANAAEPSVISAMRRLYDNRGENNGGLGFADLSVGRARANPYTSNTCSGNNGGGLQSMPAGLCR